MKRSVTFVINTFMVGGVERLILDIITHLDRNQWEPRVVAVLGGGPLLAEFQGLGVETEFAGPRRYVARSILYRLYWLASLPATLIRLIAILQRHQPEVVVTSLYQADIMGMIATHRLRIRHRIVIQHDVERLPVFIAWAKRRLALSRATQVVANSLAVADFLQNYFAVPVKKIAIIPNGIDINRFASVSKLGDEAPLVIGMIGRLEPIKGPDKFVSALIRLKQKMIERRVPALIVGGGSLDRQLRTTSQAAGLEIEFLGELTDVVPALGRIDILVIPSLAEGFGLAVLEGVAAGKLVVASDLPAVRELITNGKNGLLFPPGDIVALADQIYRLLSDQCLRQQLRLGLEEWLTRESPKYDIHQVVKRYQELWV